MPKIVFVCSSCGTKYVNDSVCQNCGEENDASKVFDPVGNPVNSVRPALPAETQYFSTVREIPNPRGQETTTTKSSKKSRGD